MNSKQLLMSLAFQAPVALIIGILASLAYSFEVDEHVTVNWILVFAITFLILAFSIGRAIRDNRKKDGEQQK